jgi:hypothetical protein
VQAYALVGSSSLLGLRIRITRPAAWSSIDLSLVDGCTARVDLPLAATPVTWTFTINTALTRPNLLVVEHPFGPDDLPDPGEAQGRATLMVYPTIGGVPTPESGPYVLAIRPPPPAYPPAT